MMRAVGLELPDERRLYAYGENDRRRVHHELFAFERGRCLLWSATFHGDEGDQFGRQHIGTQDAWVRFYLYPKCAIVELDYASAYLASQASGDYPNAGQHVSGRRIYPNDARISRDQATNFVEEFLAGPDKPNCIDWQTPCGIVAVGPFGVKLP